MVIQILVKELKWKPKLVSKCERKRKPWFEEITQGNPTGFGII